MNYVSSTFAHIDYRGSGSGRCAYIVGTEFTVREVVIAGQSFAMDPVKTARQLGWRESRVRAAFEYAEAFPAEIGIVLPGDFGLDFGLGGYFPSHAELFDLLVSDS